MLAGGSAGETRVTGSKASPVSAGLVVAVVGKALVLTLVVLGTRGVETILLEGLTARCAGLTARGWREAVSMVQPCV